MSRSLAGKLVLVTGASAGIGRACVAAFAGKGAVVLAVARTREKLEALSSELGGTARVVPLPADVTDPAAMEAVAHTVLERHGVPDVVVANAGQGMDARFTETSDDALRAILEVNVFGVVRTIRPFLPAMIARGSGRVLIVSSVVGKRGIPNYSAYAASKFALHGMADALRPEIYGTGVTVGLVCPSSTTTEFEDRKLREGPPQVRVRVQKHTPDSVARSIVRMARWTRPEMVLSPEAKLMLVMNWFSRGFLDWVLYKTLVRKR
jgi:short-subunit dehydrogenase